MELINARIEGFRNINCAQISFGDITTLVSINSYGKSNLIKALEFAIDFIKADKNMRDHMMSWVYGIPLNKYIDSKNFIIDFIFASEHEGKRYFVNYGFEFVWIKDDDKGKEIVKEWLNIKEDEKSQKYNTLINRNSKCLYKSSATGRCDNALEIQKNELTINKLLLNNSLFYYDLLENLNMINIYIDKNLDASKWYIQNPLIRKDIDEFDLNEITSIPRVIFFLKQRYPKQYELLENAFFQLFPNITGIYVSEIEVGEKSKILLSKVDVPYTVSNNVYSMLFTDTNINQPLDFRSLSDGTKKMFLMLTYIVLASLKGASLIAFEEPENSIHPNLLQSYLNVLSQLATDCKIIIASHSPYIIQYVKTEDIYIGKPNSNGIADFKKFNNKKINQLLKDAAGSSDSIGSYIFQLLSGGEDDAEILIDYLEK